jgi:Flp pilus assembly pilin Flp
MRNISAILNAAAKAFLNREQGQNLTEYALCFTMVALATVAGMDAIAHSVNTTFLAVTTTLSGAIH